MPRRLLVLFGTVAFFALAFAPLVLATPPDHTLTRVEGGDLIGCDVNGDSSAEYMLEGHFWYNLNTFTFYDRAGLPERLRWNWVWHGELTNQSTGQMVRDHQTGTEVVSLTDATYTRTGSVHLFIPSEYTLWHDAGRLILDLTTGEIVFEAGHHDFWNSSLSDPCAYTFGGAFVSWTSLPTTVIK